MEVAVFQMNDQRLAHFDKLSLIEQRLLPLPQLVTKDELILTQDVRIVVV